MIFRILLELVNIKLALFALFFQPLFNTVRSPWAILRRRYVRINFSKFDRLAPEKEEEKAEETKVESSIDAENGGEKQHEPIAIAERLAPEKEEETAEETMVESCIDAGNDGEKQYEPITIAERKEIFERITLDRVARSTKGQWRAAMLSVNRNRALGPPTDLYSVVRSMPFKDLVHFWNRKSSEAVETDPINRPTQLLGPQRWKKASLRMIKLRAVFDKTDSMANAVASTQ